MFCRKIYTSFIVFFGTSETITALEAVFESILNV